MIRRVDRSTRLFTWRGALADATRELLLRALLPIHAFRRATHRRSSGLAIHYRDTTWLSEQVGRSRGPRAGDRLPDARVSRGAHSTYLQQELSSAHVHLLLCGSLSDWNPDRIALIAKRFINVLKLSYLTREDADGVLVDVHHEALTRLGVERSAQYVIRPDGHVGFRCATSEDLGGR